MIRVILKQIKEYRNASIATPIYTLMEVFMETTIPFLMASIIDDGVNKGDMTHIYRMGSLMALFALIALFGGISCGKYGAKASTGLSKNLRAAMFEHIQTFSFHNIDKYSSAGFVTRLTTDISNVENAFRETLRMGTRAPATFLSALFFAFLINARLSCIILAAAVVLGVVIFIIISHAIQYFEQVFPKYDDLNESIEENVSAIRTVKAYVREDYETSKLRKASANIFLLFVRAESNVVINAPLMNLILYFCICTISWIGAKMITVNSLTTGELMSLLTYCMSILMSLNMFSSIFVTIAMSIPSIRRVGEVLAEEPDLVNPDNPIMEVPDGSITFDHVNFSYQEGSGEYALSDINLSIHSGETIGIIGGTGSSKTSLVNLISRLYDVSGGSVKVGGHDVRDYDIETLRNEVSVVLQNNVLFSGTIYENLRWGDPDATDEECQEACRLACADGFIRSLPEGYNTYIEQGGINVSGGQKQRLCIARALLKKPKVLILDDSTSAVDTATDARIRRAFRESIPHTTKLIIAQRISSVQDADRILVMEEGKVNAFGTHDELLATNEIYREVYESQTGGSGDFDEKAED